MPLEHLALSRSTLDRASHLRSDPALIGKLWSDAATRVIPVNRSQALVQAAGDHHATVTQLVTRAGEEWAALWGQHGHPEQHEQHGQHGAGWEPDLTEATFLGADEAGVRYLAVPVDDDLPVPEGARWAGLRDVGTDLSDADIGALVTAVAILVWHAAHRRCARCGHQTDPVLGGWQRHCPACGAEHYPRTDPAVIMAIVDADDRILLGRQAVWPEHRFSTLAGFVEPGEPLEAAVRREVAEESGVRVGDVSYRGSQPWPFPSSLMVGFRGEALSTQITVDGVELAHADWWSRERMTTDLASGELLLPPPLSIARHLIEDWYGGPLAGSQPWA